MHVCYNRRKKRKDRKAFFLKSIRKGFLCKLKNEYLFLNHKLKTESKGCIFLITN